MSNPQTVSYKETATYQLAATRTWCQRLNSNQLQQGYETCAISTSATLANLARAEGFEPPSSAFHPSDEDLSLGTPVVARQFDVELTPAIFLDELSKSNKKPGARPGPVQKQTHSDPQHTTPQMTRLVILAITCLKVCCISHTLELESTSVSGSLQSNYFKVDLHLEHLAGLEPA